MKYVTYDTDGHLTGAYIQAVHASHQANYIQVSDAEYFEWNKYQANTARNGLELAPVVVPVTPIPFSVTRRQARQALLLAGLLDSVDTAIAAITDATQRKLAQIEWEDSQDFERNRPLLVSLSAALGLNSAQLDQLFITAATL
jgi:hypothetical protein